GRARGLAGRIELLRRRHRRPAAGGAVAAVRLDLFHLLLAVATELRSQVLPQGTAGLGRQQQAHARADEQADAERTQRAKQPAAIAAGTVPYGLRCTRRSLSKVTSTVVSSRAARRAPRGSRPRRRPAGR